MKSVSIKLVRCDEICNIYSYIRKCEILKIKEIYNLRSKGHKHRLK